MTNYVVDSSVALKWYLPEAHSQSAEKLLRPGVSLHAPDYLWVEAAAVLTRRVRRKLISPSDCAYVFAALQRQNITIWPTIPPLHHAMSLGTSLEISLYDAIYLAVAIEAKGILVTADPKLIQSLARRHESHRIQWIDEL